MDSAIVDTIISEELNCETSVIEMAKNLSAVELSGREQVETDMQTYVSPKTSDCEVKPSRWLKVRDSLEGISQQARGEEVTEKGERYIKNKAPISDSILVFKKPTAHINFSKIFMWDPWNKIGRKNKKEKLRKKSEERALKLEHRNSSEGPNPILRKKSADMEQDTQFLTTLNTLQSNYVSMNNPDYSEKFHKSVRFQKEVNVVYFAGDQILEQKMEPLKKETEQQERNKELRREVNAETVSGIKFVLRKSQSDYSPGWNKK